MNICTYMKTTACTHSAVTKYLVCGYALIHVPNTGHLTYLCTRYDVLDIYIHSDVNVYMYTQWCQYHTYWHHCIWICAHTCRCPAYTVMSLCIRYSDITVYADTYCVCAGCHQKLDANMYMYTQWCQSHTYWHHCVYIVMPCIHIDVTMY